MCSDDVQCSWWSTHRGDGENGEKGINNCVVKPVVALLLTFGENVRFIDSESKDIVAFCCFYFWG